MTFCSDDPTINNFFDNLQRLIAKISKIIIGAVAGLALLAMIPMGWREIHSYRVTRRHAYMLSDPSQQFDPVDVVYIATRPHSSIFGLRIAGFFKSSRRQTLVRWAISYVTSPAALVVLSLGMAGLASIFCQWLLLKQVEAQAPGLAAQTGEFAKLIVEKLDNASKQWAIKSNEALNATNTEINKDVFGWVTTGTDSLNNTMNVFVDTMYGGVDTFFKGTPFATPIKEVLNCLITIKTVGIQRALTWAHDNAHVTLPLVPEDAFSRGAMNTIGPKSDSAASFLANPGSAASDEITEIVMKLTAKWEKSILQEAYISLALVGVWVLIVIIALIRTCFLCCVRDKVRGEGGAAPFVARDSNAALHRPQPPVFPTFGASPSTPYGPPSPEQYPDEKIQMGEVNSGQMGEYEGEGSKRESFHTRFYYKG